MLFNDYMKQFENENSPRGDLARDMRYKPIPELYRHEERLKWLKLDGACDECIETYQECWEAFEKDHQDDIKLLERIRRYMARHNIGMIDILVCDMTDKELIYMKKNMKKLCEGGKKNG